MLDQPRDDEIIDDEPDRAVRKGVPVDGAKDRYFKGSTCGDILLALCGDVLLAAEELLWPGCCDEVVA